MIKCWYYRKVVSRSADDDTPLPPAAKAHIAECDDCRRFFQVEHEIVRRLSAGAAAQKQSQPPPFLQAGIMARIASSQSADRRASNPFLRFWPAALAIACVVLTIILLRPGSRPSPGQTARVQSPHPVENTAARNWSDPALLTGLATNLDQPLETEMHAVLHDARGAAIALADNFFPEELRQSLFADTSAQR